MKMFIPQPKERGQKKKKGLFLRVLGFMAAALAFGVISGVLPQVIIIFSNTIKIILL